MKKSIAAVAMAAIAASGIALTGCGGSAEATEAKAKPKPPITTYQQMWAVQKNPTAHIGRKVDVTMETGYHMEREAKRVIFTLETENGDRGTAVAVAWKSPTFHVSGTGDEVVRVQGKIWGKTDTERTFGNVPVVVTVIEADKVTKVHDSTFDEAWRTKKEKMLTP